MVHDAAPTPDWFERLPWPSTETIDAVLDLLQIDNAAARAKLGAALRAHALSYAVGRWLREKLPPHESRDQMASLSGQVATLVSGLGALSPEHTLALQWAFKSQDPEGRPWRMFIADLKRLGDLLAKGGAIQLAKKQPNRVLKNAIGGLMLLLERATGERANARRRTAGITEPTLVNASARAIGMLLRSVDPELPVTTLVSQIEAICRENRGRDLTAYAQTLSLGAPIYPL